MWNFFMTNNALQLTNMDLQNTNLALSTYWKVTYNDWTAVVYSHVTMYNHAWYAYYITSCKTYAYMYIIHCIKF